MLNFLLNFLMNFLLSCRKDPLLICREYPQEWKSWRWHTQAAPQSSDTRGWDSGRSSGGSRGEGTWGSTRSRSVLSFKLLTIFGWQLTNIFFLTSMCMILGIMRTNDKARQPRVTYLVESSGSRYQWYSLSHCSPPISDFCPLNTACKWWTLDFYASKKAHNWRPLRKHFSEISSNPCRTNFPSKNEFSKKSYFLGKRYAWYEQHHIPLLDLRGIIVISWI